MVFHRQSENDACGRNETTPFRDDFLVRPATVSREPHNNRYCNNTKDSYEDDIAPVSIQGEALFWQPRPRRRELSSSELFLAEQRDHGLRDQGLSGERRMYVAGASGKFDQ